MGETGLETRQEVKTTMSLTSHLKHYAESPVGQFFRQRFPHTAAVTRATNPSLKAATTIRPAGQLPYPYSTVGMALDYRIRYHFTITPWVRFVAWQGAWKLLSPTSRWELYQQQTQSGKATLVPSVDEDDSMSVQYPAAIITSFFDRLDALLARVQPVGRRMEPEAEQELARYCFVLALFEEVYRTPNWESGPLIIPLTRQSVEELLAVPEQTVIDDLCQLSALFYDRFHDLLTLPHVLNPTFKGSSDVDGADADLIVDGCLIDIKASVHSRINPEWLRQMVGYALLDYDDAYQITSVGIYMARQGRLFTWPLADLLSQLTGDPTATVERLRQELQIRVDNKAATILTSPLSKNDNKTI